MTEVILDPYVCRKCHRVYLYLDMMGDPECECGSDRWYWVPNGEELEKQIKEMIDE